MSKITPVSARSANNVARLLRRFAEDTGEVQAKKLAGSTTLADPSSAAVAALARRSGQPTVKASDLPRAPSSFATILGGLTADAERHMSNRYGGNLRQFVGSAMQSVLREG